MRPHTATSIGLPLTRILESCLLGRSSMSVPSVTGAKAHVLKRAELELAAQAFCSVLVSLPRRQLKIESLVSSLGRAVGSE